MSENPATPHVDYYSAEDYVTLPGALPYTEKGNLMRKPATAIIHYSLKNSCHLPDHRLANVQYSQNSSMLRGTVAEVKEFIGIGAHRLRRFGNNLMRHFKEIELGNRLQSFQKKLGTFATQACNTILLPPSTFNRRETGEAPFVFPLSSEEIAAAETWQEVGLNNPFATSSPARESGGRHRAPDDLQVAYAGRHRARR